MKNRTAYMCFALLLALSPLACKRGEKSHEGQVETETIAPADGKPAETTTSEMTQTVDIEDSRSEAEGSGITTTTVTTTQTTTTPPKKTRRKG